MDRSYDIEQAKRDIDELGIINIEASSDLTPAYVCDAVRAVKEMNLDFDDLAKQMERARSNPRR